MTKEEKLPPPWSRAVVVSGLTRDEAADKMEKLGKEARALRKDVPAHGPGMPGAQARRSVKIRANGTGIR